jgi:mannosyl-oligosaccharide alpha-1,2-mannosidase
LKPITKTYQTWFDLGLTLVDSLDTMLMMNLKEEFDEAREWISTKFKLDVNRDVNLFETTIRVLGSLLSTYHLSKDKLFLDKAEDLADR